MFNFVFAQRNDSRPWPNSAPMMSNPHESYHGMGDQYPWIVPCRLLLYADDHSYPVNISYLDEPIPVHAFYPIGLGWFDYSIDYFAQLPKQAIELLVQQQLTVLFYYHEGDNPALEKARLDTLCIEHNLPMDCYKFISGNTLADHLPGFVYFPDHELFYWRNSVVWNGQAQPGAEPHQRPRSRQFTALSRLHKWWRATVISYLHREGWLDRSYWSYNTISMGDRPKDNPIELWCFNNLKDYMDNFVAGAPYACDSLSAVEHNSHWLYQPEHYEDAYCNLVLETMYDAEQSNGAFLSEKVFKPIRHAQPFVVFGTVDSLRTLRRLGYRTFDHAINNAYDQEINNTDRFIKTIQQVKRLTTVDLHEWYLSCLDDIQHNQELFVASKYARLETLYQQLTMNPNSV